MAAVTVASRTVRVLVTGGCGFIGANLVPMLLGRGIAVRVLDDLSAGASDRLDGDAVELLVGDVRDPDAVARAMAGVDAVVHLAAAGSVADSVADPVANFDVNARGTLVALQGAARAEVPRFVFASTGGALIGDAPPPVDEQSLPKPLSPYGASKLCGEGYCEAFRHSYGLGTLALRFANVYGPRSEHKRGAVTAFVTRALCDQPLVVYGDGSATRDFVHVDDLCAGIAAAVERPEVTGVLHLASERETAIDDLARLVLELTGADVGVGVEHRPRRTGEVERNMASARRAADALGFRAEIPLEAGLATTIEWFRATRERWEARLLCAS
jgi:UDP-glucose 4-epimerase